MKPEASSPQSDNAVNLRLEKSGPNYWDAYELRAEDASRRVARIAVVDGAPMVMVMPGAALGLSVPMLHALSRAAVACGEAQPADTPKGVVGKTKPSKP